MVRGKHRASTGVSLLQIAGELFLTASVLVFLFLGWMVWFNDIVVEAEHEAAAAELSQSWTPEESNAQVSDDSESWGDPPVVTVPAENEKFGVLHVPRFGDGYSRPIAEGISLNPVLNRIGIGHYPGTQMPGEPGNFVLAAHRTTYGKPFNRIAELRDGDPIVVETADGWYTYRFTGSEVVRPYEVEVLLPVPRKPGVEPTESIITLTSCHPMWSAAKRYIAHGVFESWRPISAGPPAALGGN